MAFMVTVHIFGQINSRPMLKNSMAISRLCLFTLILLLGANSLLAQKKDGPSRSANTSKSAAKPGGRSAQKGNVNRGNNVSVDNSKTNVNINVDNSKDVNINNSRNTVVRPNPINTYHRPPYVHGGHRYYCYHPYVYHPYKPFYWGPVWHPWGFFVATLATTAIIVSIENQKYHYDQGVWYASTTGGYTVVQAPVGATVATVPTGSQTVVVNNVTNNYYGGAYYMKQPDGTYKVVPPPAGAVVDNLPEGGKEVKVGDQTYVVVGETYYAPIKVDGKDKYEVVQVEKE
jgi:hypothetical protein